MDQETAIRLLEELRKRLIIIVVTVFMVAVACFIFIDHIRYVLMLPEELMIFKQLLPEEGFKMRIIYLTPSEALMANLRLSFVASALVTLPVILYQLVALILAVSKRSRRSAIGLTVAMYILFGLGISFAYFVVFPFALNFFLGFSADDLQAEFSIARYISFAVNFLFSFGLVFQLPLVFWFLGSIGLVSPPFLRRNRKFALLIVIVFSAVLTPPDVFSQVLMTIPLMVLYEVGIILVYLTQRKRTRHEAEQALAE
jgi:sec-independent protein translocase protein TatC